MNKTILLEAEDSKDLHRAMDLLQQGKLVAVPTETVYGLAADAENEDAVSHIYKAKKRPIKHPLIVHIGDIKQLAHWAIDIPPAANILASKLWPGPLTLILKKNPDVHSIVTGGMNSIALRVPDHPVLLNILQQTGMSLAAPSANPYGQLSPTNAQQVLDTMHGKIDAVLNGGECRIGLESTILDMRSEPLRILRAGPVTATQIETLTGLKTETPERHTEVVPGNVAAHYQPNAKLKLFDKTSLLQKIASMNDSTVCVVYSKAFSDMNSEKIVHLPADKQGYAKAMYKTLYALDQRKVQEIWLETPPKDEVWQDVNDRLARAATTIE